METVILAVTAVFISLLTLCLGYVNLFIIEKKQESAESKMNENLKLLKDLTKALNDRKS